MEEFVNVAMKRILRRIELDIAGCKSEQDAQIRLLTFQLERRYERQLSDWR
jgi:hypothetical protein